MKALKLSWMGLLALVCIIVFYSCKKDVSITNETEAAGLANTMRTDGSAKVAAPSCTEVRGCNTLTKTLFAGQTINVGSAQAGGGFTITKLPNGDLTLKFQLGEGVNYELDEVHVYVGDGLGLSEPGGDAPGQFPYSEKNLAAGTKTVTITVPAAQVPALPVTGCYVVAAHAAISPLPGSTASGETAWACGDRITTSGNWSMKFDFCPSITECDIVVDPPSRCALSQGYWFANTTIRNIVWGQPVTFGTTVFTQAQIQPLFPAKTDVVLKALFQASALQLDVEVSNKGLTWEYINTYYNTVHQAYNNISSYFNSNPNLSIKPNASKAKELQSWASTISDFIKSTHCDNVYDQQALVQ